MCLKSSKMDMEGPSKVRWTLYITLVSMLVFVSVSDVGPLLSISQSLFSFSNHNRNNKYVIVFDGGSTGTRIHVFTFLLKADGSLSLTEEYFEEVKPGLSSYAHKPSKAANSVVYLLEKAKHIVPSDYWEETPVALKATAGLRLLPSSISDSILDSVSEAFQNSPFSVEDDSVSVLDGEDEGLYAWYTINFLLDSLTTPSHSAVTLDLGGGSTQVTFTPVEFSTFVHNRKDFILSKTIKNKTMPLYTHSYLGLGLMAARLNILHLSSEESGSNSSSSHSSETKFKSSCIHPQTKAVWKYDAKEYTVKGRKDEKYGFEECYDKAAEFLGDHVDKPEELQNREIYALSYYFDRAVDMGIIGKIRGSRTVGEFMEACKKVCSGKPNTKPFLCLDCSYIAALLHHGLGFSIRKEILFIEQIDGIETSWGLGAAFNMLK